MPDHADEHPKRIFTKGQIFHREKLDTYMGKAHVFHVGSLSYNENRGGDVDDREETTGHFSQAERVASKLLREQSALKTPINAIRLAKALGYEVYQASFKDNAISGGVNFQKQGGKIYLNRNDSPTRQRFTLAHELGHCIMHREYYRNGILERIDMFRNPENHSQEEVEANAFAANLLMPEQMVREMWKRWGSTEILADIFKVSLSTMSYRLYNLHLKGDCEMPADREEDEIQDFSDKS